MNSAVLSACTSGASYWVPSPSVPAFGWIEHTPFAFWLIDALRPKTVVELGPRAGVSYFAFCQAVRTLRLDSRCYSIVQPAAGAAAQDQAFKTAADHNASQYAAFSRVYEADVGKAAADLAERSVDVLCFAEGTPPELVRTAMEQWRPRLGERCVVLLHGINTPEHGGGHGRLWHEMTRTQEHFEFLHGGGLGILCVGKPPAALERLFRSAGDPDALHTVRTVYTRLGQALADRTAREAAEAQLHELASGRVSPHRASEGPAAADSDIASLKLELAQNSKLLNFVSALASQREAERDEMRIQFEAARAQVEASRAQFDLLVRSKSWRVTRPMREMLHWRVVRVLRRAFR